MNIKTVEVDIIISRLLPYKIKTHYLVGYFRNGADEGNRTPVVSLEG